jgi:hypothetical protein
MRANSASVRVKSNTAKFSAIRSRRTDFGITTTSRYKLPSSSRLAERAHPCVFETLRQLPTVDVSLDFDDDDATAAVHGHDVGSTSSGDGQAGELAGREPPP